ncbi:copper chaperone PCu(A)C [Nocardia thailandica]
MSLTVGFPLRASRAVGLAAVAAALFGAAACTADPAAPAPSGTSADRITLTDQWIKAADSGMSAAFGTLRNSGDAPVTLVAAASPAAGRMEIHEVVAGDTGEKTMRPKAGGLVIPAHGEATLKPGADHLMFLDLTAPLRTGAETPLTLTFDDGSTTVVTARVRDFSGGKENYEPEAGTAHHG